MKDQNDEPAFFVSRRGKQVGVHQVDLSGIDIESSNPSGAAVAKPTRAKAPKKLKTTKATAPRQGWTKRKVAIVVAIILILSLPFVAAEFVVAQYKTGVTSAKRDLDSLITKTVLPAQKKSTISSTQIGEVADDVNAIVGRMCRGGLLDNAAGLYPRARSALNDCKTSQTAYSSLAGSLYGLEGQATYLEQVDAAIKPVATPITDEYAVIGAQQTAWKTAAEKLKGLIPPASLGSAHSELMAHVTSASDAWSKLNTANNARDAAGFETAEQSLTTAYESIRGTSNDFTEVLAVTQSTILKNYNSIK